MSINILLPKEKSLLLRKAVNTPKVKKKKTIITRKLTLIYCNIHKLITDNIQSEEQHRESGIIQ